MKIDLGPKENLMMPQYESEPPEHDFFPSNYEDLTPQKICDYTVPGQHSLQKMNVNVFETIFLFTKTLTYIVNHIKILKPC